MTIERYLKIIKNDIDNCYGVNCNGVCGDDCPYNNICDKLEELSIELGKILEDK